MVDAAQTKKLKKCKLCNGKYFPHIYKTRKKEWDYWIGCSCYNYTEKFETEKQAIECWNQLN